MPRKPTGNPNGRPRKEIDKRQFETLCAIMCTELEICEVFDISEDTLNRWCKREYGQTFAETYKKKSAKGKASLRRLQFQLAEKSPAMAIFLGKNYLGQSDKDSYDVQNTEARTAAINNGQTGTIIEDLTPLANMINNDYEQTTDD